MLPKSIAAALGAALALFVLALSPATRAADEEDDVGLNEFEISCMPCHGPQGRGDGPRARELKIEPADLTLITKRNGGKFPAEDLARIIDGRDIVAAHGVRDMPVWGDRYRINTEPGVPPSEIDQRARDMIEALVAFLSSIQAP